MLKRFSPPHRHHRTPLPSRSVLKTIRRHYTTKKSSPLNTEKIKEIITLIQRSNPQIVSREEDVQKIIKTLNDLWIYDMAQLRYLTNEDLFSLCKVHGLPYGLMLLLTTESHEREGVEKETFFQRVKRLSWRMKLLLVVVVLFLVLFGDDLYAILMRQLYSQIEIDDRDDAFQWVMFWLTHLEYSKNDCKHLAVYSENRYHFDVPVFSILGGEATEESVNSSDKKVSFLPSPNSTHYLWYDGKIIWIELYRSKEEGGDKSERIKIGTYSRDQDFVKEIVHQSQQMFLQEKHGNTVIFTPNKYFDSWDEAVRKDPRDPSTVILSDGIKENIFEEIDNFYHNYPFYQNRGIPYKRGYLLYGPPGTGKTSLVTTIASKFNLDICIVNLTSKNLTDENFIGLMQKTPQNCIVLIEDVDNLIFSTSSYADELDNFKFDKRSKISLSTLLNCLDGVTSKTGRLIFLTANDKSRLPSALIRPGRIDKSYLIDFANPLQIEKLFSHFYSHIGNADILAKELTEELYKNDIKEVSPAALQGHFICYSENPEDAIKHIKTLVVNSH